MQLNTTEVQNVANGKELQNHKQIRQKENRAAKNAKQLRVHITSTYNWLRYGMVAIGFLLPWILWGVGEVLFDQSLLVVDHTKFDGWPDYRYTTGKSGGSHDQEISHIAQ
jgi:hypothetical protein